MQITIAERFRPYTHVAGSSLVLPGTGYRVQVYPCLIRVFDLSVATSLLISECTLDIHGPVDQFTVFDDLEKGRITVSGKGSEGWIRYHLLSAAAGRGVRLVIEKAPEKGISVLNKGNYSILKNGEALDLFVEDVSFSPYSVPLCDRLSLGNHKAQDWDLISRRFDLSELLPLVHRLGQLTPAHQAGNCREGTLALLDDCRQRMIEGHPEKGEEAFRRFFMGCFHSFLVPQLQDSNYLGLVHEMSLSSHLSPLAILTEASRLIRQLFVQQKSKEIVILPYLLPSLHCGRLINVPLEGGGKLSLEWTKKTIRQIIVQFAEEGEYYFTFGPAVRSYRLRTRGRGKGDRIDCGGSLHVNKESFYFFDNFL